MLTRAQVRAAIVAGVVAGIVSTLAQGVMWVTLTDSFPAILWRDTRFAAAIVLGDAALSGGRSAAAVWIAATLIHFVLSIVYASLLGVAVRTRTLPVAFLIGGVFGVALYVVNMYGFTTVYPWFAEARDPITLGAHVVFGATAAIVFRCMGDPTQGD